MNRKQYLTTLIVYGIVSLGLIISNGIMEYLEWMWIVIIITLGFLYIRYKISGPLQTYSKRFNMMVDYDLDVEGALKLTQENYDNAPTASVKSLFMIYLGMAYYYNGKYQEAINTFNQINLSKVNQVYHVLIFAFTAYAAFEIEDIETLDLSINRIEDTKDRLNKRYHGFAIGYADILNAMKNLELDPERYQEIIERSFSRDDGYISTKLVYNYRMAHYYKVLGKTEEMDICLAKVIANGKNHHTALQAKKMFQNTCNIEDYVFTEKEDDLEEVNILDNPALLEELEPVEMVNEEKDKEE